MPTFLESLAATDRAREESALILLQREERALASHRAVESVRQMLEHDDWESSDPYQRGQPGLGSAANDLLHMGAMNFHNARPGSRQHGDYPPFYRTEMHHWEMVDAARTLEALCPTAVNVLEILTQFAIHTGFTYKVMPRGDKDGTKEYVPTGEIQLVKQAQKLIDDWHKSVDWYSWETEIFRRTIRDGECFLVMEPDELSDMLSLRSVEPEQVTEPKDSRARSADLGIRDSDASWRYGILTTKENTSFPLGYWIISQYAEKQSRGSFYRHDEVFHLKSQGTDRQAKRGIPDFFCVANDIPSTRKLLRNLREGGAVQAAIAFIRQHPPGMDPYRMGSGAEATTTRSGVRTSAIHLDGPMALDVSYGLEYIPGPIADAGKAGILIEVLQAALRGIGARWQMPEGMISGDASNANLASALVAEGPFVRAMQYRQWHFRNAYQSVHERMLYLAARIGMLGPARENILDDLEVSVKMPPVLARKPGDETERNATLNERNVLSIRSWSAREDLDFEEEQENAKKEPTIVRVGSQQLRELGQDGVPADDDQPATERALQ